MDDLLGRHKRYLRAAFQAAPNPESAFDPYKVGEAVGFTRQETDDAIALLRGKYVRTAGIDPMDRPLCAVTKYGRACAGQIGDDDRRDRRQRLLNVVYALWLFVLTLLQAGTGKWVQTLVERAMREPVPGDMAKHAATALATSP